MVDSRAPIGLQAARALVVLALLAVPLFLANRASSDTTNLPPGVLTTVSSPTQANVSPNGPLTGLHDGDTLSVTVTATGASAGKFFGADARLCKAGLSIAFTAQFNPTTGGVCVNAPLSADSDDFQTASAAPTNMTVTFDFHVGIGTQTYTFAGSHSSTITCDSSNPCALWLNEAYDVDTFGGTGSAFVHYDLHFAGAAVSTTTSTAPTSTTSTTATAGSTTSSVAATSTTAGGATSTSTSTTSTTIGSGATTTTTSTTLASTTSSTTTTTHPVTASNAGGGGSGLGLTGVESRHVAWSGLSFVLAGGLLLYVGLRRRHPGSK